MASLITSSAGPAKLLQDYFEDRLDTYLKNTLLAADLMESMILPANRGNQVDFHRLNSLPKQVAGITQSMGSAHSAIFTTGGQLKGEAFTVDSVSVPLVLIGNDLELSEQVIMTADPNPVPALSRLFLYQAADTLDQIYVNSMVCSTANGTSNTATVPSINLNGSSVSVTTIWGDGSATLTEATLDADIPSHRIAAETFNTAEATLIAQSAKKRNGVFNALISPQIAGDLRVDGTFQDIALKGNQRGEAKFERASIGEVFGCRVMVSENVSVSFPATVDATNDDIHRCPVVGQGYAARISHARGVGRPQVRFIPPTPSAADVYGNNGFLMWKIYYATTVLDPYCGVIIKAATTRAHPTGTGDAAEWE